MVRARGHIRVAGGRRLEHAAERPGAASFALARAQRAIGRRRHIEHRLAVEMRGMTNALVAREREVPREEIDRAFDAIAFDALDVVIEPYCSSQLANRGAQSFAELLIAAPQVALHFGDAMLLAVEQTPHPVRRDRGRGVAEFGAQQWFPDARGHPRHAPLVAPEDLAGPGLG